MVLMLSIDETGFAHARQGTRSIVFSSLSADFLYSST